MKYAYNITLNFNREYYDFYEWNTSDRIINIKKIPIYRVSNEDYLSIKYNDVIIDNEIGNMLLITNTIEVMGIILKNGKVIKKSSLLLNEEDEILDAIDNMKVTKIKFKRNLYKKRFLFSRTNIEKKKFINKFFKRNNKKDSEYLYRYIYYDLYKKEDTIENIYLTLSKKCDINLLYNEIKKIIKEKR